MPCNFLSSPARKICMPRKFLVRAAVLAVTCILTAQAADTTEVPQASKIAPAADSTSIATTAPAVPLLPSTLGPIESVMWSEHGLMRKAFDFPLTEEGRDHEMHLRRTLLTVHQAGGFATLAAMIATCAVGQLIYNGGHDNMRGLKDGLATTTIFLYFSTASLALFTPPPLIRRNEWSSVSTHKLLGAVHFTGMILTPLLADAIGDRRPGHSGSRTYETIHMVSGYTTTVAFAAAMLVVTF